MNTRKAFLKGKNSLQHLQCSNHLWLPLEFQCQVLVSWFDTQDSFNVVAYDSQTQLLISSVPNTMALWILEWTWRVITESWASCLKKIKLLKSLHSLALVGSWVHTIGIFLHISKWQFRWIPDPLTLLLTSQESLIVLSWSIHLRSLVAAWRAGIWLKCWSNICCFNNDTGTESSHHGFPGLM